MSKLTWLVAGGVGYLLGSKAGRAPYEKVSAQFQQFMENPRVRQGTAQAKQTVKRKADEVADTVMDSVAGDSDTPRTTGGVP